ncbi:MAG: response regulator [Nitrosopumilus sp.]|nr:response regulator [Nitrosopumilus sp.]NNL36837.1 response regulator [Nitrosopumilus sp.]
MTNCIVIDDDPDIVAVFCDLLNMINLKVLATDKSGKNALKLYEEHEPDLVFTDLQMPGYDGIYVIESIKDKYPDAKIIIVTGALNHENSELISVLDLPVIHKPYDSEKIHKIITDALLKEYELPDSFDIQYQFKNDVNIYSCTMTYLQYRNFKKLPIVLQCIVANAKKTMEVDLDKMEEALILAVHDDATQIRKLSEVVNN